MPGYVSGRLRRVAWGTGLTAAFLVAGAVPAEAHQHPTPIERAAPGVVYVEARARVEVSLVEHRQRRDPSGIHIVIVQSTSDPVLASSSGFVVDRTGAVVANGSITATDLDRARVYAVNEAFRKRYGAEAPLPGDLFTRQQVGAPDDPLQQRLDACYPPNRTNDAGGCVVSVTPTYVVYPYVTSQEKYGQLDAELLPGSTPDIAVLRVRGANSMPTVALGNSTAGASAVTALGFTAVPDADHQLQVIDSHLDKAGGTALKSQELDEAETKGAARLAKGLARGMQGGPVVAEGGQVIGFLATGPGTGPPPAPSGRLVDVGKIREVLAKDGVTARRGPADTSFEAAMHPFKNRAFAASIPNFKATLALFPGHFLAAENLAVAERNAGTQAPSGAATGGGLPAAAGAVSAASGRWTIVLPALAGLVLLTAVGVLLLRRRRLAGTRREAAPATASQTQPGRAPATPAAAAQGRRERQSQSSAAVPAPAGGMSVAERAAPARSSVDGTGRGVPTRSPGAASPGAASPGAATSGVASSGVASAGAGSAGAGVSRSGSRVSVPGQGPRRASPSQAGSPPVRSPRPDMSSESSASAKQLFCTSCGAQLAPHHRFCGNCGRAVG
jgi:hypothetical protein